MADKDATRAGSRFPLDWWRDPAYDMGSSPRDLLGRLVSWSAENLTDGHVPGRVYRQLLAAVDDPNAGDVLLARGHLQAVGHDFFLPKWEVFNLPAERVRALIQQRTDAINRRWDKVKGPGRRGPAGYDSNHEPYYEPKYGPNNEQNYEPNAEGPDESPPDTTRSTSRTTSRTTARNTRLPESVDRTPYTDSPPVAPRAAGGRTPRQRGTSPRQLDKVEQDRAETERKARAERKRRRELARMDGQINDAELVDLTARDADPPAGRPSGYAFRGNGNGHADGAHPFRGTDAIFDADAGDEEPIFGGEIFGDGHERLRGHRAHRAENQKRADAQVTS